MMGCDRRKIVYRTLVDEWTGESYEEREEVEECEFFDTSLHSYSCGVCGEKFWYSERGKIAEQTGVDVMDVPLPQSSRHDG